MPLEVPDDRRLGEGDERALPGRVEAVDCLDQTDPGDLDEVVDRLAPGREPPGQPDREAVIVAEQLGAQRGVPGRRVAPVELGERISAFRARPSPGRLVIRFALRTRGAPRAGSGATQPPAATRGRATTDYRLFAQRYPHGQATGIRACRRYPSPAEGLSSEGSSVRPARVQAPQRHRFRPEAPGPNDQRQSISTQSYIGHELFAREQFPKCLQENTLSENPCVQRSSGFRRSTGSPAHTRKTVAYLTLKRKLFESQHVRLTHRRELVRRGSRSNEPLGGSLHDIP